MSWSFILVEFRLSGRLSLGSVGRQSCRGAGAESREHGKGSNQVLTDHVSSFDEKS